jgi:uncharacterized membrane protein
VVVASVVAGLAVVAGRHAAAQRDAHPEWGRNTGNPWIGAGAGVAAATGLAATATLAGWGTRRAAVAVAERRGGRPGWWVAAGGLAAAATAAAGAAAARRRVFASLADDARAPDAALAAPIDDPHVSGGPGSVVAYDSLSREGRRYVHWRVSGDHLREQGITPVAEPVRVFVGLDSADSVSARVDLAMAELDRLGAFDRAHLVAICPAGSGYANSVPVEALEILSGGDCASVVVQYGLLPSMFSLDKIPVAAEGYRLLIDRIRARLNVLPPGSGPLLHLYGESLGALIAEEALTRDPSLVDLDRASLEGVASALFVGSPGGSHLRDALRFHSGVVHVDRWQDLPPLPPADCRFWFLDHDADPVTRFEPPLAARKPRWLDGQPRGRNIPDQMRWFPVATWQQVMLDVAYATQAQSGVFRSLGHDYRADLAPLVAAAWHGQPGADIAGVQELLAQREVTRDRMLAAAEASAQ